MNFSEISKAIIGQLEETLSRIPPATVEGFCNHLLEARAVFVTGEGRSGMVGRCFAMRLMHLGLTVYFVGEVLTPALAPDDVLVAISGSGETALTQTIARQARKAGGKVVTVTAVADATLNSLAELTLLVPAQDNIQFGGSLFEQSALITLDAIALLLQQKLGMSKEQMESRHANIE